MNGIATRAPLKEISKEIIRTSGIKTRHNTYRTNLLYHIYLKNGGKRLIKIDNAKYIMWPLELRYIYNSERFSSKTKYPTLDAIIRYIVFKFWKTAESGGATISEPHTTVHSTGDGESVSIAYSAVINGRYSERKVDAFISNEASGKNLEDLITSLIYEMHILFGGNDQGFEELKICLDNLGYRLVERKYV
jgi:hypothetical protein